jgi:hypothetical protein
VATQQLSKLSGIYGCKDITAGNAPDLNDDVTAIPLMTRVRTNDHGVKLEKSVSFTLFGREILRGT